MVERKNTLKTKSAPGHRDQDQELRRQVQELRNQDQEQQGQTRTAYHQGSDDYPPSRAASAVASVREKGDATLDRGELQKLNPHTIKNE